MKIVGPKRIIVKENCENSRTKENHYVGLSSNYENSRPKENTTKRNCYLYIKIVSAVQGKTIILWQTSRGVMMGKITRITTDNKGELLGGNFQRGMDKEQLLSKKC